MKRSRKRKASDTAQLRVWRWLNWHKLQSWVCLCANVNGYGVHQCPDCLMKKPAPPTAVSPLTPPAQAVEDVVTICPTCHGKGYRVTASNEHKHPKEPTP